MRVRRVALTLLSLRRPDPRARPALQRILARERDEKVLRRARALLRAVEGEGSEARPLSG